MANKSTKATPPSSVKTTAGKGKTPVAKPGAAKAGKPSSKTASKPSAKSIKPARKPRPIRQGMSLDRKLDITGIILAFAGLLTLLSLLSPINSSLIGQFVGALKKAFGLGVYLFPIALGVIGLWLILRSFERVPQLAVERLLGIVLLYLNLLAVFTFIGVQTSGQGAYELAELGRGGGYLGAFVFEGLRSILGEVGAGIVLLAWLIIALALTLDLTVLELVRWIPPLFTRFQDWWIERREERRNHQSASASRQDLPPFTSQAVQSALTPAQAASPPAPTSFSPAAVTPAPVWVLPPLAQVLDEGSDIEHDDTLDLQRAHLIEETLTSFGAPARVVEINRGPTITQFGVEPDFVETRGSRTRVRVGKIASLVDDLALALSARTIRIQAPVPGKGFVGIEVPNEQIGVVALRDVIESEAFHRLKSPLRFALGQNVAGNAVAADLAGMPHLLIAGATGSGKSVCVNSIICCLLINNTPDDLRLIMVDPKRVELTNYNGIPHLLAPVVVELERVVTALQWVTREMDMRYHKLAEAGARNIQDYNNRALSHGIKKLPYLVVIIDELADLMMLAPDDTERAITRLAQLSRATGIHLVIATQRPSVDVVTGLIKANFPARIAFAVASGVDSRVILDQPGAERLLGQGDMLFQAPDAPTAVRLQGVFVSESEILRLVTDWQSQAGAAEAAPSAMGGAPDAMPPGVPLKQMPMWEDMAVEENVDPLFNEAVDLARAQGRASISMLQRRLRIGYTRGARLIEEMEAKGIIGPPDPGTGAREILDYGPAAPPVEEQGG
jgi:S-DNA-T family DNA segregation ATPase FtsK/SpoIIIE